MKSTTCPTGNPGLSEDAVGPRDASARLEVPAEGPACGWHPPLADGGNCPPCPAGLTYQKAATVIASIAPVMAGQ